MKPKDTAVRNRYYRCLEYDHDQEGSLYLVACGIERADPGTVFGPEVRDCYHLHAVLSGTGTLHAGGQVFHPRPGTLFLLKDNRDVIAINQDPDGRGCYRLPTYGNPDAFVLVKPLSNGDYAVGFFNFGDVTARVEVHFWDMGLTRESGKPLYLYDCLAGKTLGPCGEFHAASVAPHGCQLYRASLKRK